MSLVSEQQLNPEPQRIRHLYPKLTDTEVSELSKMASYFFAHKVVARPTLGSLARVAMIKMYNELNEKLARGESIDG